MISLFRNAGVSSFHWILEKKFDFQILWNLSSVDFHTFTLQLPIQDQNSVAPELQDFVSSLEISAKQAHPWNLFLQIQFILN